MLLVSRLSFRLCCHLPETQSLPSTMPRAARLSAALQAPTSPPPALVTSNTSLQHPFLHLLASGSSFPQLSSVHVLPALLQPSGDHGGLNLLQTAQETLEEEKMEWAQERERIEKERKQKEQEDHEHEQEVHVKRGSEREKRMMNF